MNHEFIDKMKEAKKLEGEALLLILPEKVRGHVEVIEKEVKSMFLELIADFAMGKKEQEQNGEATTGRVQKVKID